MIFNYRTGDKTSDKKYTTVSIPTPLVEKIKEHIEGTGFTSVSSYVTYVLREGTQLVIAEIQGCEVSEVTYVLW